MSLDTVTLQCFLAVAETQSFTKAALRIGRTQSAVSQQIAKLENMLDKSLFNRGRELSLTTDGELFLGYAKRIYELHRESLDRFKAPELHGELRFGLPEDFASTMLSDVLLEFTSLHPRVMLNVQCDLTLNLIERYKKGEFDLILIKMNQDYDISDKVIVWDEPVEWVGKKDLLPSLDQNTLIPLILSPSPCVYRGNVIDSLDQYGMDWRLVYSSPSYAGKMAAVRAGLGITAIQRSLIPNYLDRLDFSFLPPLNNIQISLLKKNESNKAVESLEYFILKKLKH
ncbi:LysR substrate-binding domain-containing protein [Legionella yabuuchiae]|uniref:LysR substrate-binding domain-containing protein n=1 Tax=Legionella yabuuchiae TaxID=376727 RepID=UPI0010563981|nr:LysR substrate-binding domain-containing protein [Legionella yabuuchiae]